jgi:hypothetical protein
MVDLRGCDFKITFRDFKNLLTQSHDVEVKLGKIYSWLQR